MKSRYMRNLLDIANQVHDLAWVKGWHSKREKEDRFVERSCNNLHDEVSELHEAWRENRLHDYCDKHDAMKAAGLVPLTCLEEELADIIIRALDIALRLDVNIVYAINQKHRFNMTRPRRHGGKRS